MSHQFLYSITRKARLWPAFSQETVKLPQPPVSPAFPALFLFSTLFASLCCACVGLLLLFFGRALSQTFFLAATICTLCMLSLCLFCYTRFMLARSELHKARERYRQRLQEAEKRLQFLHQQERQARMQLAPPLALSTSVLPIYEQLTIVPLLKRTLDEHDPDLWTRRPTDPDFLSVRFGLGQVASRFHIQPPTQESSSSAFTPLLDAAQALQSTYSTLTAPLSLSLYQRAPVALVGGVPILPRVRTLAQNLVAQLAYHHSPLDLRILLLAPQSQNLTWQWLRSLPHTLPLDAEQATEAGYDPQSIRMVALGSTAVLEQLSALSHELTHREQLLQDLSALTPPVSPSPARIRLPHLVVVIDYFAPDEEPSLPFSNTPDSSTTRSGQNWPLQRPELLRALHYGPELGVSVLCLNTSRHTIPANSSALLQIGSPTIHAGRALTETTPIPSVARYASESQPQEELDQINKPQIEATLYELGPSAPPAQTACQLDLCPPSSLHEFARRLQQLQPAPENQPELRSQVDFRLLFTPPLDINEKHQLLRWQDAQFRSPSFTGKNNPLLRVPIGMKRGDELQYLDLLKDGPHGLLIGQAGSGKNELLQCLLLSLTLAYRPSEFTLLLIEQGTSQTLAPFRTLPHTLSYLPPNPSPTQVQRFLTMLSAEALKREVRQREGRIQPRLLVLLDECFDSTPTEPLLDAFLSLAPHLPGLHLLFVAESPFNPSSKAPTRRYQQIRDLVQYRLCLRCNSVEESRAVIYRDDAAFLPASLPGRAYLLHSDQQMDLFQAARLVQPAFQEPARPRYEPSTDKNVALTTPIMKG